MAHWLIQLITPHWSPLYRRACGRQGQAKEGIYNGNIGGHGMQTYAVTPVIIMAEQTITH